MAILCVGNELFYIYLYEYFHFSSLLEPYHFLFQFLIIPTWAMKQLMNIIQLYSSSIELIEFELKKKK
jgi:hypothetical protein